MGADCCKATGAVGETSESTLDEDIVKFLQQVKLFKRLPAELIPSLATVSQKVVYTDGQCIINQGDEGHEFFVICSGAAAVIVDGKVVASLSTGDHFGENALLRDEARTATIKATSAVSALKVSRENFQRLGLHERLEFQRRGAVGGGGLEVQVKPPSPKTEEERKLMVQALKANSNLQTMAQLSDSQINDLISVAWKETVSTGTALIRQGDLDANYFYIVQDGSFEVLISGESKSAEQASTTAPSIEKGGSFGELALLYFAPRAATIKARTAATVWVMDRMNFKTILSKSSEVAVKKHMEYLKSVELLSSLQDDERKALAEALEEYVFNKGESIMTQGEPGDNFYILVDGECTVLKDGKEQAKLKGDVAKPAFFGEQALMNNAPRSATIQVLSDTATVLACDKTGFELVLGPLEAIKKRGAMGKSMVGKGTRPLDTPSSDPKARFGNIRRKDLKRLGLLGCGGFGAVELVEHVVTKETYALKALSKGYIVKSGMQKSVMAEKDVQIMCDSPFIIKLYETFNGEQSLYLLLELALGGELYATYNKKDLFGKETHARFYTAGVVYAFDHMHSKKIIFRDLKPENLLLTNTGHIKLTDMGLAKVVAGKTFTTCGTPDYFAPELVQSAGHTRAVDWWTLGILTFELMVGRPPFESPTPMQIYQKVVRGISRVNFPPKVKPACVALIKSLCSSEPTKRLPMLKGGTKNLMDHPWYQGFAWDEMMAMTMPVPYKPQVRNNKDVANFSARKEDMPPQVPYKDDGSKWDKDFATSS